MCGVLAAPILPTINIFIHPSSISLPSGGDVWDTGHLPGLVGSRAHQSASPVPLCFTQKQEIGIIVESPALRDRPPLDSNRDQCEEKEKERSSSPFPFSSSNFQFPFFNSSF